jgi:hypothetical protein
MTLAEMLTTLPRAQLPVTLTCTADPTLQRIAEGVGYTLIASTQGRCEWDPITGAWVQLGLDTMTLSRAPLQGGC